MDQRHGDTPNHYHYEKLKAFVNTHLQQILQISGPNAISNNVLLRRTKHVQITETQEKEMAVDLTQPSQELKQYFCQSLDWNPQDLS